MSGPAIKTLTLSHFRSHRASSLAFDGRPVAIVGANGAGKTNVLEAMSLLSPGRGLRRAATEDLAQKPDALGWKVRAEVAGPGGAHDLETWAGPGDLRQVRIDGKPAPHARLARILRILWLVPAMDRLWIEAAEGRRRFLDRMTLSFVPEHAELSITYERAMRDRNRLLKDQVADPHWYAALEHRMAEAGRQITANRLMALGRIAGADTPDSAFPTARLALTGPEGSPEPEDLQTALTEGRRRDLAAGRTLQGPHRADLAAIYASKNMTADQCSTGEQKALLISLILANARALAQETGHPPILLLDEVAAHLDTGRRAALFDEICALGAQAVMTGTEPDLFDSLGRRGQWLMIADVGGGSVITDQEEYE